MASGGDDAKTFSLDTLSKYDGQNDSPVYISLKGTVFDVSSRKDMYGPGGGYNIFAGKDASYSLAKMTLAPEDTNKFDCSLTEDEQNTLNKWIETYREKYPVVGKLVDDKIKAFPQCTTEGVSSNTKEEQKCPAGGQEEKKGECPFPFILLHDPKKGILTHPIKCAGIIGLLVAYFSFGFTSSCVNGYQKFKNLFLIQNQTVRSPLNE